MQIFIKRILEFLCIFMMILAINICALGNPEIDIPETIWEIGNIKLDEEITHTFKIMNTGSEELKISQIRSSCGCLKVELSSNTIQPGGYAEIKGIFKEDERLGDMVKTIYIESNAPDSPRATIRVKATVLGKDETSSQKTVTKVEPSKIEVSQDGIVNITFFFSEDCSDCAYVKSELFPALHKKYPGILNIESHSIDDLDGYDLLVAMEEHFGDMGNEIPVIFIGTDVLGGREEVVNNLEKLIEKYKLLGGADFPKISKAELKKSETVSDKIVYIAYFEKPGCKDCDRASYILKNMERLYPNLEVRIFNSDRKEDIELFEAICSLYNVPEKKRLIAPSIFIGDHHLLIDEINDKNLRNIIEQYKDIGTKEPWEEAEKMRSSAKKSLIDRFKSLGPFAIIIAGLIDGVNPCAFATIILFMSYLAIIGRKGKSLIYVGIAFTGSVFLTYFLVGLGIFKFIQTLSVFSIFSKILYIVIALLAFALGVLSFYDFLKARKGKAKDMFLQLPEFLKNRIQKTIRGRARTERFVIAAFVTGVVVSLLELACTGQVYLPTLVFVVGVPELKKNAILYLILYNLMFVVPLIVVFIITYFGTSSTSLANFMQKHIALVKLLTSILFFGLCAFLIVTLI